MYTILAKFVNQGFPRVWTDTRLDSYCNKYMQQLQALYIYINKTEESKQSVFAVVNNIILWPLGLKHSL